MTSRVVWINGTFGVGKTTTAKAVAASRADLRVFDPEEVGFMLRRNLADYPVDDFQDGPSWRQLVAHTAGALIEQTGQSLVVPQTVLSQPYWNEIKRLLLRLRIGVTHVLLDCTPDVLVQRIRASQEAL